MKFWRTPVLDSTVVVQRQAQEEERVHKEISARMKLTQRR